MTMVTMLILTLVLLVQNVRASLAALDCAAQCLLPSPQSQNQSQSQRQNRELLLDATSGAGVDAARVR